MFSIYFRNVLGFNYYSEFLIYSDRFILNSSSSQQVPDIDFLRSAIQMALENDSTYEGSENNLKQQDYYSR